MNQTVSEVKKVHKAFGGVSVLKGVDSGVQKGEIHAPVGENGTGKSTPIKIISGVYTRNSGFLHLEGKETSFANPKDTMDAGIRVIRQEINTTQTLTVAENIFLGNYPTKHGIVDWKELCKDVRKAMEILGDSIDAEQKVSKISIAGQQMIETAEAVSAEPKALIMDELTAALNDQETESLFELLGSLRKKGVSIIYVTRRFSETCRLTDRVIVLRDGGSVVTLTKAGISDDLLVKLMVGEDKIARYIKREARRGGEVFYTRSLSAEGSLDSTRLSTRRGGIAVVFGLMGAGQIGLCKVIFSDLSHTKGTLLPDGKEVHINNVRDACRKGIEHVSDDRRNEGVIPLLSVQENIYTPSYPGKLPNQLGLIKKKTAKRTAQLYYNRLHVKSSGLGQKTGSLSGGNQQKGVICRWLANDVRLLILNMPTRGVDVGARAEIYWALEDLADQGVAMLAISPEMQEVLVLVDVVYVTRRGIVAGEVGRKGAAQKKLTKPTLGID